MSMISLHRKIVVDKDGRSLNQDNLTQKVSAVSKRTYTGLTEAIDDAINAYSPLDPLPSEYQEVEWLANAGRSYIDTGYYPDMYDRVKIKFSFYSSGETSANQIMGSANGTSGYPGFVIGCSLNSDRTGGTYWIRMHNTSTSSNPGVSFSVDGQPHTFEITRQDVIYDGISKGWSVAPTLTATKLTSPFYLFCRAYNTRKAYPVSGNFNFIRIYSCEIRRGLELMRERMYVPCYRKSDNKPGMYDLVTREFYINAGEDEFLIGPDVSEKKEILEWVPDDYQALEYIESTGTQYIDTGINLNATTDATEIDYMSLKAEGVSFQVPIGSCNIDNGTNGYHFYIGGTNTISVRNGNRDATSTGTLWGNGERHVAKITHDGFYLDNSFYPITSENINQDYSCFVLARNTAGVAAAQCTGRVYRATIYRNGIEKRKFIPAMRCSDKVVGMYDLCGSICSLTGTPFYINAGTGEFLKPKYTRIPDEYQEITYIESLGSGTYIDTGYHFSSNTIKVIAKATSANASGTEQHLFGNIAPAGDLGFKYGKANSSGTKMFLRSNYNTADANVWSATITANTIYTMEIVYDLPNNTKSIKLNTAAATSAAASASVASSEGSFVIFSQKSENPTASSSWTGRLYYMEVYDNGNQVMNLIPCIRKSDAICGFYDAIRREFYYNDSASLLAGSIVYYPSGNIYPKSKSNTIIARNNKMVIPSTTAIYFKDFINRSNNKTGSNDKTLKDAVDRLMQSYWFNDAYDYLDWIGSLNNANSTLNVGFGAKDVYDIEIELALKNIGSTKQNFIGPNTLFLTFTNGIPFYDYNQTRFPAVAANEFHVYRFSTFTYRTPIKLMSVDGDVYEYTGTYSYNSTADVKLFRNQATTTSFGKGKVKYIKAYISGLYRYLLPVRRKADGEIGMYDVNSKAFYKNDINAQLYGSKDGELFISGFENIDYIDTDGTNLINTNIISEQVSSIELDGQILEIAPNVRLFGKAFNTDSRVRYYLNADNELVAQIGNATGYSFGAADTNRHIYKLNAYTKTASVDNASFTFGGTYTNNNSHPVRLGGYLNGSSGGYNYAKIRIYGYKVYTSGNAIQREFVPVRRISDGKVGLYETTYGSFKTLTAT